MVLEIILGASVVANGLLLYGVRNLLKQNEQLEDDLVGTVYDVTQQVREANAKMEQADIRGSFESDDEVGTIFQSIKEVINDINNLSEKDSVSEKG